MTRQLPHDSSRRFAKGHGTENDFLVLPDPAGHLSLSAAEVARLCDRRTGIGADGLLRAVRCTADPEAAPWANQAEWFMDYRNADGTLGTMCGNGIRVLARYLVDQGHARPGTFPIATRAGLRHVHVPPTACHGEDAPIRVAMGRPLLLNHSVHVTANGRCWPATPVDMGNPHAVVFVDDLAHAGDLLTSPQVTPVDAYPAGVTVEFVTQVSPHHLALRVHERGVGETRACGTGACAAVAATISRTRPPAAAAEYTVTSPGGRLRISVHADMTMDLLGPAVITAHGTLNLP
jgi:diaminopimelate epimerase